MTFGRGALELRRISPFKLSGLPRDAGLEAPDEILLAERIVELVVFNA